jgi:hypothetical protein
MKQFALAKMADRDRLFDTNEVEALDRHFDAIGDAARPTEVTRAMWPFRLMYGAFLPQPFLSIDDAERALHDAVPKWHGWVKQDACFALGVCAIKTYPAVDYHGPRIPVAVLVQASEDTFELMEGAAPQAISAFVRYANRTPTENLQERPGILALKGEEKNLKTPLLMLHNWKQSIDDTRARRAAERIR